MMEDDYNNQNKKTEVMPIIDWKGIAMDPKKGTL